MFNFKLPTPAELKTFQIDHYTEMMGNPRTFEHKIFLRKQIYNLKKTKMETMKTIFACVGAVTILASVALVLAILFGKSVLQCDDNEYEDWINQN